MSLYEYLIKNYNENEPIFVSEIQIRGMTDVNLRQQIKKLADRGTIKRFDAGICFISKEAVFRSGSQLSSYTVIEQKHIRGKQGRYGYIRGIMFANQIGLTLQVIMKKDM